MPNWAYTQYVVTGDKHQLQKLYSIMNELECMKDPGMHENGFGSTWLGNLVIKLGGDWKKIYCRGSWDNLLHENEVISFSVESAWDEPDEVRHLIEEKFPDIKLYYQCEESGMGIYITNDGTGQYFPEKYYLWIENGETDYYDNLESLIQDVERITGSKNLKTLDSCRKALETYSRNNSELCYTLEEFNVVND
ncbi:MAG: hypothetical protein HDR38_05750 [Treponema sp.]|nr:hypothetical protein [Treponema sp.]